MPETNQSTALSQYAGLRGQPVTMTSREIADLTGKDLGHVHRDIRSMLAELVEHDPNLDRPREDKDARGYTVCFYLNRELTETLLTGYSAELRRKVIRRWHELEANQAQSLPNFADPAAAAIAWAEQYRARQLAEETKAHIGHKREATAMATASVAVRKATKLEIELDRSKEYATVKRMEMAYHGTKFDWRLLKSTAAAMEVPAIDVFDQNYGTVKAYHASVWMEAYAVEIGGAV